MPWTREENLFRDTSYLKAKSIKTVLTKSRMIFHFYNYHQKSQFYRSVHKFQATGSVKKKKKKIKKEENPRSGRKLTARCLDNVHVLKESVERSPSDNVGLSFASWQKSLKKDLQLYLDNDPDQA